MLKKRGIKPEVLTSAYEIAADLERIDIIREKALTPQLRKENRIKTIHSSLWIEANSLTLEQVTKKLKINESTVYRNIEKLKELGVLVRKESDKTGIWIIKQVSKV